MRRAPLLAALLVLLTCPLGRDRSALASDAPAKPAAGASPLTDADRQFFAWWDAKGFPDVGTLPFVKVWTGGWSHSSDVRDVEAGFLVRQEGKTFTAFLTDLQTITVEENAGDEPGSGRVGFEKADLETYVRAGLGAMSKEGPEIPWFRKSDPFGAHRWAVPNQAFRIAVLARALAARGLEDLARTMLDRALHEETRPSMTEQYGDDDPSPRASYSDLQAAIQSESAVVLEARFLDERLSWDDLLAAHEAWARAFAPESLDSPDGDVAVLRRMVEEASGRKREDAKPLEEQSPAERIATLVHDLQDVNVHSYDSWGVSPQSDQKKPKGAHQQLVDIGLDAAPALIEALDNERFTRTMEIYHSFKGQFRSGGRVLRVGELAWFVLDGISGGALAQTERGPPTSGRPTRRRAAEAWFTAVQAKGDRALLSEQIARGDRSSRAAADRLMTIDPDAAVKPLETGILAGDEYSGRENLVYVLASMTSEPAIAAMLRLVEPLRGTRSGITLASALWRQGKREGLDALIRWWRQQGPPETDEVARYRFGTSGSDDLIGALANTGHPDAVRALSEDIGSRSASDRVGIVTRFTPSDPSGYHDPHEMAASPETEPVIEKLLAERLSDGDRAEGLHLGSEEIGAEPIVGEMAAWTLARRYPEHWKFDASAPAAGRAAARLALANAWRVREGLPQMEAPKPVTVPPVAAEVAKARIQAWLAGAGASRETAEAEIVTAGLGMLPHLQGARDALEAGAPHREALDLLVRRVACIVREISWSEKGPRPSASLSAYVESIRGKPVSGAWITGLWRTVALHTPEGATGIDTRITRPGDGTGAVIVLELTTRAVPWQGGDSGWVLDGDGLELVEDDDLRAAGSWWHKTRQPQIQTDFLVPETLEIRFRRAISRGKG